MLSVLAERRLAASQNADIGSLMQDLASPPIAQIGALPVNSFLKKRERTSLAAALNNLLASRTFRSWRKGASLDIERIATRSYSTPCSDWRPGGSSSRMRMPLMLARFY